MVRARTMGTRSKALQAEAAGADWLWKLTAETGDQLVTEREFGRNCLNDEAKDESPIHQLQKALGDKTSATQILQQPFEVLNTTFVPLEQEHAEPEKATGEPVQGDEKPAASSSAAPSSSTATATTTTSTVAIAFAFGCNDEGTE